MIIKVNDKIRKSDILLKPENDPTPTKRTHQISHDFGKQAIRRHSVFSAVPDFP